MQEGTNGQVLLFNIGKEKKERIVGLGRKLGLVVRQIEVPDYGKPMGELLLPVSGRQGQGAAVRVSPLRAEMMVFCGLAEQTLDAFLADYRQAEIEPIPLKAVITPYNINWTPEKLVTELSEEHQAMNRR